MSGIHIELSYLLRWWWLHIFIYSRRPHMISLSAPNFSKVIIIRYRNERMHITTLTGALIKKWYAINGVSRSYDLPLVGSRSLSEHHVLRLRSYVTFLLEYFLLLSRRRGVIRKVLVIHGWLRIRLRRRCRLCCY